MKKQLSYTILGIVLLLMSCNTYNEKSKADPLPSWNETQTKQNIIEFVESVTNKTSSDYIEPEDRIATFDNDGNLWSEQPLYFQVLFIMDRVKSMANEHPEWKSEQPFKAVLDNDMEGVLNQGMKGLVKLAMATHSGITTEEFVEIVKEWMATAKHPTLHRPYTELVFQPMLELINYLQENNFKTFIVSGGGIEFMRPWVEEVYGIPRDQVVGSSIKTEYDYNNGNPFIKRLPEIEFFDDKEGKPEAINKFIGRKPVFASGNSDGDLQMLRWAASNKLKSFMLYVHHTDSIREWAYDRESHIGRLDKGLDEALKNEWTVIDMEKDWKVIYPFELSSK